MSDSDVIRILEDFSEYLSSANIFIDPFRWLMWIFVQGLSLIIDGMENITNEVLLVKNFFESPAILNFLQTFRPAIIVLFALSILFTGYLFIFKRKVQGEAIVVNLTIAIAIFTILTPGIQKINGMTDEAIDAINVANLYNNETGTISENIVVRNTTDLLAFDRNDWSTQDVNNNIPPSLVLKLKATERFDPGELKLTNSKVAENYLSWNGQEKGLVEFDQGGVADWNNEYYYRYHFNWFTIIVSLLVMGFTLFTITLKLAKLSYEIAFNQILAMIIAPTDLHDGTKTKKILQNIFNVFIVIILMFLSMRLYIIGLEYLTNNFDGMVYLFLLIGFSLALIDGPNVVERLYGIDAGIKSGWGVLAAVLTATKVGGSLAKGALKNASSMANKISDGSSDVKNTGTNNKSPLRKGNENAKSPFKESNNENKVEHPLQDNSGKSGDNVATSGQSEQASPVDSEVSSPTSTPVSPSEPVSSPTSTPSPSEPVSSPTSTPTPSEPVSSPTSTPSPSEPASSPASTPTPSAPASTPTPSEPVSSPASTPTPSAPVSSPASTSTPSAPASSPASTPTPSEPVSSPASTSTPSAPASSPASTPTPSEPVSSPASTSTPSAPASSPASTSTPSAPASSPASTSTPSAPVSSPASTSTPSAPASSPASTPTPSEPASSPASTSAPSAPQPKSRVEMDKKRTTSGQIDRKSKRK